MSILGPKCGINGCKKGKLRPHTHFIGAGGISGVDRNLVARYREYAEMRGEPCSVPGGDANDMKVYMTDRLKDGAKEAKEFRKRISDEMKAMKKRGEKPDERKAAEAVKKQKKKRW